MKMLSRKDEDDDNYGGGGKTKVGKNNKNQKNSTSNNTNINNNINNSNSNNVMDNTDKVIHNYIECSAYCHANKRIGDTEDGKDCETEMRGGGGGTGTGTGEGERTRAYWLCQLPVSSISLVTDQKISVKENYGLRDSAPCDVAHASLLPAMSDLTALASGKIHTSKRQKKQ